VLLAVLGVFGVLRVLGVGALGGLGVGGLCVLGVIHEIYLLFSCTSGTEVVFPGRIKICGAFTEKMVDKRAGIVYTTGENKEGRCIRLTSRRRQRGQQRHSNARGDVCVVSRVQRASAFLFWIGGASVLARYSIN
jgi:hypothetical protein